MALTGVLVFLGAFLLFLVQPVIAKLILPRFGGSVAVWATCLVFFQAALLLGYAAAHALVRQQGRQAATWLHRALLLGSLALLPIVPLVAIGPASTALGPALQIVLLLTLSIGLPFTLLAMTSPLLQAWIAGGRGGGADPYRLFALSNLASLAALLAYPWLIEPWLRTARQAHVWSAAYAVYVVFLLIVSLRRPVAPAAIAATTEVSAPPPPWPRRLGWFALAGLGSYELVAVTNHLTQNIPSFPMMWVLPLVIYLLSFTLCFDGERWYAPRAYSIALLLALPGMCLLLLAERQIHNIAWHIAGFLLGLFVVCMFCHGELARSRPAASRLTHFYLAVSAGGVFGGAVVALGAPALLPGYFEVEIGLMLLAAALLWPLRRAAPGWRIASALVLAGTLATAIWRVHDALNQVVDIGRNFYGVLRIREYEADRPLQHERTLIHGRVMHGQQFLAPKRRRQPTSYYTETSGVGRLLTTLSDRPIAIGAVGLGAGTIATYGKPGDRYRFYEIDPAIVAAAQRYFSFIADSAAEVEVRIGDGRLLLQDDTAARYDVLVVDAFSGDAIPTHLLTREAIELYRQRLKPGGVIALHLSNSHLDLRPVAARIATDLGMELAYVADAGTDDIANAVSDWVLLAEDRSILDQPLIAQATKPVPRVASTRAWTDDYSNIVQVMSFGRVD